MYCENNPVGFIDPLGLEYIVVSGGVYSDPKEHSGYRYNFIEPAITKINEWLSLNDGENIKWIIANSGWNTSERKKFNNVISNMAAVHSNNISLKFIDDKTQLFDYINYKDNNSRSNDKIEKFVVFSHGFTDGTVALGYNYSDTYNKKLNINKNDITSGKVHSRAFNNANSMFYSCNTGTGENSFAQLWENIAGGKTWAFEGKTNYAKMYIGESNLMKLSRVKNGFSYLGAWNYPIASNEARVRVFIK